MKHLKTIAAAAALLGGVAAAGLVAAQDGPRGPGGPMGFGGPIDFVAIDANADGSLSRDELVARATERMSAADANGDGTIDRAELIAFLPAPRGGLMQVFAPNPAEDMADRVLALLGATEAGQVELGTLTDARVNLLMATADADHDGAISRAEADEMRPHGGRGGHRGGEGRHGRHDGGPRHGMMPAPDDVDAPEAPSQG
jgi:Ca2+-binding EF-hand superfamily protein